MNGNVCALFVLYNPSQDDIDYIKSFSSCFNKTIVFDNSIMESDQFDLIENCEYFNDGANHGLAYAYNFCMKKLYEAGFDWLAIFDQDSRTSGSRLMPLFNYLPIAENNVAMVCPFVQYDDTPLIECDKEYESVNWAINSGSFLNLHVINSYALYYDEYYFLDRLDRDYCKTLKNNHFQIIRVNNAVLCQRLGEKNGKSTYHSPLRNYYMARNRLYYNHKFYNSLYGGILSLLQTIKHVLIVFNSKVDISDSLKMIFCGIKDYYLDIGGKKELL